MAVLSILEPVNHLTVEKDETASEQSAQVVASRNDGFLMTDADRARWDSAFENITASAFTPAN